MLMGLAWKAWEVAQEPHVTKVFPLEAPSFACLYKYRSSPEAPETWLSALCIKQFHPHKINNQ